MSARRGGATPTTLPQHVCTYRRPAPDAVSGPSDLVQPLLAHRPTYTRLFLSSSHTGVGKRPCALSATLYWCSPRMRQPSIDNLHRCDNPHSVYVQAALARRGKGPSQACQCLPRKQNHIHVPAKNRNHGRKCRCHESHATVASRGPHLTAARCPAAAETQAAAPPTRGPSPKRPWAPASAAGFAAASAASPRAAQRT